MPVHAIDRRSTLGSEYLGEDPADEGLDMEAVADEIVRRLLEPREGEGPDVSSQGLERLPGRLVGVFGYWGSGKTHLLNVLGKKLVVLREKLVGRAGRRERFYVCCFRAWEYETDDDLAAAFLRALVNEQNYAWGQKPPTFEQFLPSGKTLRQAVWKFADFVCRLGASAPIPGAGLIAEIGEILMELRRADQPLSPEPVADQIRHAMAAAVDRILGGAGHLFVLVDDLDRCAPPNIVRLFEWFKIHLDTARSTYILGLDHRMAAKSIVGHYKGHIELDPQESLDYGFRYLDKLFELDFEILPSSMTENMALAKLAMESQTVAKWTRQRMGKDFGGEAEMQRVLSASALWVPRVMIRALSTYRMGMDALLHQHQLDDSLLSNDLPSSFPYWLFLLSALHHLFPPDTVESFVRTELKNLDKIGNALGKYGEIDPRLELQDALNETTIEPLSVPQMRYLYQIVREKTPRSYRDRTGLAER
jgi:hypothetical protein